MFGAWTGFGVCLTHGSGGDSGWSDMLDDSGVRVYSRNLYCDFWFDYSMFR